MQWSIPVIPAHLRGWDCKATRSGPACTTHRDPVSKEWALDEGQQTVFSSEQERRRRWWVRQGCAVAPSVAGIEKSPSNQLLRAGGLSLRFFKMRSYSCFCEEHRNRRWTAVCSVKRESLYICLSLSFPPDKRASEYILPGEWIILVLETHELSSWWNINSPLRRNTVIVHFYFEDLQKV